MDSTKTLDLMSRPAEDQQINDTDHTNKPSGSQSALIPWPRAVEAMMDDISESFSAQGSGTSKFEKTLKQASSRAESDLKDNDASSGESDKQNGAPNERSNYVLHGKPNDVLAEKLNGASHDKPYGWPQEKPNVWPHDKPSGAPNGQASRPRAGAIDRRPNIATMAAENNALLAEIQDRIGEEKYDSDISRLSAENDALIAQIRERSRRAMTRNGKAPYFQRHTSPVGRPQYGPERPPDAGARANGRSTHRFRGCRGGRPTGRQPTFSIADEDEDKSIVGNTMLNRASRFLRDDKEETTMDDTRLNETSPPLNDDKEETTLDDKRLSETSTSLDNENDEANLSDTTISMTRFSRDDKDGAATLGDEKLDGPASCLNEADVEAILEDIRRNAPTCLKDGKKKAALCKKGFSSAPGSTTSSYEDCDESVSVPKDFLCDMVVLLHDQTQQLNICMTLYRKLYDNYQDMMESMKRFHAQYDMEYRRSVALEHNARVRNANRVLAREGVSVMSVKLEPLRVTCRGERTGEFIINFPSTRYATFALRNGAVRSILYDLEITPRSDLKEHHSQLWQAIW
ncbi:hypothetical protein CDD81_1366 [Ophiocordyceps australis]|uniref:Uncharacterized protein n=1 Tax=Ophiocordyceps australis TaxID=1399860 RepID=A0A2C5XZX2_9HYPO|nr:hypothetical protein CDD81_1366 [Ophiocordyceps australis]